MKDSFKLPVTYKGEDLEFDAQLVTYGYSHRFHIDIDGITVLYEPDEERKYRAMLDNDSQEKGRKLNTELVRLVGEKIQELTSKIIIVV